MAKNEIPKLYPTEILNLQEDVINEAQLWARLAGEKDQEYRSNMAQRNANYKKDEEVISTEFQRLGLDIEKWQNFLERELTDPDESNLQLKLRVFLDMFKDEKVDEKNQESLKALLKKIGSFPKLSIFGRPVVDTAWLIFQHADKDIEFQKTGLKLMYESRKEGKNTKGQATDVDLVYFFYLTDRITMGLYGYQFFGTQRQGANLIALPKNIREKFGHDPALFCTLLINQPIDNESQQVPSNPDMLELWIIAQNDSQTLDGQNCAILEFIQKFGPQVDFESNSD